jgi:serine/threonine protein kinase
VVPPGSPDEEMTATHEERVVRARAKVGAVLNDKYRLDRVVGVGGMAAVYAATHLRNASRVAVKVLHAEMAADANVRARFLREGYAANSVEHPGTVRILDDDSTEDGSVFLVMELLEGETIDHRWERNGHRLGDREVARLMYQVLDVLAAAHDKGIVHRDIKPENLFLTRAGAVKLLDFGIARLTDAPVTATRPGGIVGTPAFMAPEQVLGKVVDAQSDLYSVAATAFALLSKRYVHEADNAGEMMVIVGSRPARSLALVCPELPKPLAAVFDRALRFDKTERWADAREMKSALASSYRDSFDAPIPGSDESEDETILRVPTGAAEVPARSGRSDRAAAAVTVLTGATPVITHHGQPAPHGLRSTERRLFRPPVLAGVGGVLAVAVVAFAVITAGSSSPETSPSSQPTAAAGGAGAPHKSEPPSAWSAPADEKPAALDPPSVPVESLPAVPTAAQPAAPSPPPVAPPAAAPARVAPAAKPSSCVPPFTIDPATSKKKWKLECL